MVASQAVLQVSSQLYWSRPSQVQFYALNIAALSIFSRAQPILAVLSSAFYAVETIKRSPHPITMVGTGIFDPRLFVEYMSPWIWGEVFPAQLESLTQMFSAILWAEPLAISAEQVAQKMTSVATRGCALAILTPGRLTAISPTGEPGRKPASASLEPYKAIRLLRQLGWSVDAVMAFGGPRMAFWQVLRKAFQKIGWLDWSDRCLITMNSRMKEPSWSVQLSSLVLIHARLP